MSYRPIYAPLWGISNGEGISPRQKPPLPPSYNNGSSSGQPRQIYLLYKQESSCSFIQRPPRRCGISPILGQDGSTLLDFFYLAPTLCSLLTILNLPYGSPIEAAESTDESNALFLLTLYWASEQRFHNIILLQIDTDLPTTNSLGQWLEVELDYILPRALEYHQGVSGPIQCFQHLLRGWFRFQDAPIWLGINCLTCIIHKAQFRWELRVETATHFYEFWG